VLLLTLCSLPGVWACDCPYQVRSQQRQSLAALHDPYFGILDHHDRSDSHWDSAQVVQEIKVMRTSVTAREKERAERATLVQQEKLSKAKVMPRLCCLALSPG